MHGVTGAMSGQGDNLLCIGRHVNDPRATCAGVVYPGRKSGCVFLFKGTGGQKITARYVISPDIVWQPLTLDGESLHC